jgi:hypothetical protein
MAKFLSFFLLTSVVVLVVGDKSIRKLREIDVRTGKMRERIFVCGASIRERVNETDFSKLWLKYNHEYPEPHWQPESRTSAVFGGPSPHFGYHGAFSWQEGIVAAFEESHFEPELQIIIMSNYVKILSADQPIDAQRYSTGILGLVKIGTSMNKEDCPDWVFTPNTK